MEGLVDCQLCRYAFNPNPLLKHAPMQCRRRPPVPVPVQQPGGIGSIAMWPLVTRGDFCGEGVQGTPRSVARPVEIPS